MTSSISTEAQDLICRYLSGELPLFAIEAWLRQEADAPPLPDFDWQAPGLQQRLEAALSALLPAGRLRHWELAYKLPWILSEEPRACWAVELCHRLQNEGLACLAPVAEAIATGRIADGFDWDLVRQVIPELKPGASLILHALASGELQLAEQGYVLDAQMRELLESDSDWRGANARIEAWQAQHRHLLPVQP